MATSTGAVLQLDDASFASEIEGAGGLALVDFGADWCGPCRMMHPTVEQLAASYAGKVKVAQIDTDASPGTATRFGIRSLPTFLLFKDGKVVDRVIGAVPRAMLEAKLQEHL